MLFRSDPAFTQKIEPALWRRVLDDLAKSRENTVEILMLVRELHATKQTTVHQDTIIAMARKIRPNVASREQALIELEAAVDLAAERQARGEAGSNVDEFVDAVLKELNRLTRQGELAQAASEADRAVAVYEDRIAREQAGFGMVLQAAIDQHKLNYDPEGVAKYLARQLTLETPDASQRFAELRAVQDEYYVRGRDKGINLDLAISIALARQSQRIAKTQDERDAALNDLAISLQTLGEREGSAERLAEAVTAYRAALEEYTQARVPLEWATTQNNLGAALKTLGEREGSAERLAEAVTAFRAALEERTQARVPFDWAKTQFNLGGVELAYFTLTADPAHLDRAAAYAQAARAVFVEKAATHYITMAGEQLAQIAAKRP